MFRKNNTCLVIAQSGRALAQSARTSGWSVHVLDRFADEDTASLSSTCHVISGDDNGLNVDELRENLAIFFRTPLQGVVYGSGLERHHDLLDFLCRHWTLFGNEAAVAKSCNNPELFFPIVTRLGIPHPHTSLTKPAQSGGAEKWLIKKIGACGGGHIHAFSAHDPAHPGCYFQRKMTGRSISVVFLADTSKATIVGFNEIWTVDPDRDDFRYAGAVACPDIPQSVKRVLEETVIVLVREMGLKGLCGMDAIVDENGECHILEINPRPPATFELHQKKHNLFEAHILACQGMLPALTSAPRLLSAHKICYADRNFVIPDFAWPEWASDRPRSGRTIRSGAPVCVVHAEGGCVNDVRMLLDARLTEIRRLMGLQQLAA